MVVIGWFLVGLFYKEFNRSEYKERFYRNYLGVEFGFFIWDILFLVVGKRCCSIKFLRVSYVLIFVSCGMRWNKRYIGVLILFIFFWLFN